LVARIAIGVAFSNEDSVEQFFQLQSRQVNNMTADTTISASICIAARIAVARFIARVTLGIATGNTETFEEVAERNLRQATSATGIVARSAVVSNIARIALISAAMLCCKEIPQPLAEFKLRQAGVVAADFAARVNI
jgi:hypothetical protein